MQKFLVLLVIFFYATTLFGAYDVKIGVYKNAKNLRANIAKIKSTKYRKSIVIDKKGKLYYAHAMLSSGIEARSALHGYKKVFEDAFIVQEETKLKKQKQLVKLENKKSQTKKTSKFQNPIKAKTLLKDKTVYLCYDAAPKDFRNRVVKMVFSENNIEYIPLDDNSSKLNIDYVFNDDTVILELLDMNVTHKIYGVTEEYLMANNSSNDVIVYTLRYYFNQNKALDFIKSNKR